MIRIKRAGVMMNNTIYLLRVVGKDCMVRRCVKTRVSIVEKMAEQDGMCKTELT